MHVPDEGDQSRLLPQPLAHRTGILLSKVADYGRAEFERALAPLGLKPRYYGVLAVLAAEGPAPQQALGARLRLDRTTMVAVVDELERLGLAERRRNRQDRRAYDVTITDAGRQLLPHLEMLAAAVEDTVFAPLNIAQRQLLHNLLTQLVRPPHEEQGA